jgi:hypothetical protein
MPDQPRPYLLPEVPQLPTAVLERVRTDYSRFAGEPWPRPFEEFLLDRYEIDVGTHYGGVELKNPWGKASGQLSMTCRQVQEDVEAGLGFVVLKTVIAQDEAGARAMDAWAIKESRMVAEPIVGRSGKEGWTISWRGRGWWQSFDEYLELLRASRELARPSGTLIVPSCKFHLPTPQETAWKTEEYQYTTRRLLEVWRETSPTRTEPMLLEKDFSPTLAGSEHSAARAKVLEWLHTVGRLVQEAAADARDPGRPAVKLGLKLFNALFDDEFQIEMLRTIHEAGAGRPVYFIYGNRLFDPQREFDGTTGIAYGGPDLSDRNLRVLAKFRQLADEGGVSEPLLPFSGTGNIVTGRMALEYALRGASSFQLHTFFQLPADQYSRTTGTKNEKALHELYFHPETGFIVWLHHLARALQLPRAPIRFRDVVGQGPLLER